MPVKDIFINAFTVYKRNFGKLFIPLLVLQLVILLPLLFFTMPGTMNAARALLVNLSNISRNGESIDSMLYVFVFIVLMLLFFSPIIISNTVYVIERDSKGQCVSFSQSLGFSRKNYGSMISSYLAGIVCGTPVIFVIVMMLYNLFISEFDPALMAGGDVVLIILSAAMALLYFLGTVFLPYVVVAEGKKGFNALFTSFKYIYTDFISNLTRLALAALLMVAVAGGINWLAQLPFEDLFYLYLKNPAAALKEPLMVFAIVISIIAIFIVAFMLPFWYAFSFFTYTGARERFHKKYPQADESC